jgi:hypothetical protein
MLILGLGILSVGIFFITKIGSESNDLIKWVEQNKDDLLKERFCAQDTLQRGVCIYPNNPIEAPKTNKGVLITIYNIFGEEITGINVKQTNLDQFTDLESLGVGLENVEISPGEEYIHYVALRKETAGVCTFKVELIGSGNKIFRTDSFSFIVE